MKRIIIFSILHCEKEKKKNKKKEILKGSFKLEVIVSSPAGKDQARTSLKKAALTFRQRTHEPGHIQADEWA